MIRLAECMSRLGTETAFEVLARAKALEAQGRDIIHLEIGEPDFDTAPHIVEAACRALRSGATHYTPAPGIPELREAIAEVTSESRGHPVDMNQVVVTPGAKPIMFFTIMALGEPGKEIIYPNPGFPIYESMIHFVGAKAVPVPLREEKGFRFDVQELIDLITDRTALIILNSPQNPTGGILTEEDLEAMAEVGVERDIPVLSDEVYEHLIYDGDFHSITRCEGMSTRERTILLHGFSKTYAMTGWRIGYGVMPAHLAEHVARLMVNSVSCTNAATQWAAVEALRGPQDAVASMVDAFRERREVIVNGLNAVPGMRCVSPGGAFYAFPNITGTGMTSKEAEDFFLQEAGVACLAGTSFGEYGQGYLRLSYANSVGAIRSALGRMTEALEKRKG